mmetsp:Transcript_34451/g.79651  ORF Transcript_34451/g.79651 Transcript_34451/m.79651 type:complete len:374 (-) Transcript_34451:495-1616(-)|eukprot:CAMPEP_0113312376 /NCGR_PEP_ID=MMETSP0010_2-20120614/9236_1 /TAXON_ID=216773 ORGANISM="Corethron hystrix, Strain 308" /NCGR_SAMPLE_ID=MMETSP0010_2 /ASSEMBLY_ACC=CAM_ASM_000155 /LENGTH=373 /DNA_ID=CAMNT_0000168199 /DNA_START=138 /DNA_END=1259 /DNA_ORIENTATION=+ /assembly_acc=CAM_ASM_000155
MNRLFFTVENVLKTSSISNNAYMYLRGGVRKISAGGSIAGRPKLSYLDLRGSGLSILERLILEEALLRHDPKNRCWALVGTHDPTYNTRCRQVSSMDPDDRSYGDLISKRNENCAIILGIGGKPSELVNIAASHGDSILLIKRFTGGGTVVVDHSTLYTSFIGRETALPHVQPYPRNIMSWSEDAIFGPMFHKLSAMVSDETIKKRTPSLVVGGTSCGIANLEKTTLHTEKDECNNVSEFALRENDYILGNRKMGGNAQTITKTGWIHHTSFLWDYLEENMEYLTLPSKRPDYRGDRSHDEFLVKLSEKYKMLPKGGKDEFFLVLREVTGQVFDVENVKLEDALQIVDDNLGGMQKWFDGKCRTRILNWKDIV